MPSLAEEIVSTVKAGRILDLDTDPGHLPVEIAKRSPDIKVDGIDVSRRLIKMARVNADRAGVAERLNFEMGNAFSLRFDDGSYYMVISTGMLHLLKDPVGVVKECYRVLKPGGKAWIYDPAQLTSQVNIRRWKASFTLIERFMYLLFLLFEKTSPGSLVSGPTPSWKGGPTPRRELKKSPWSLDQ
jgi:ubiquinone/menaquinone biosynthesis C-methylase UbiE